MCHFGSYRFAQPVILLYKGPLEGHSSPYIFQQHQNLAIKSIILYPYSSSLTRGRRGAINHAWKLASFCSIKTIKEENFGAQIILLCFLLLLYFFSPMRVSSISDPVLSLKGHLSSFIQLAFPGIWQWRSVSLSGNDTQTFLQKACFQT